MRDNPNKNIYTEKNATFYFHAMADTHIIETNQGMERLRRFLFASSSVYTIKSSY